MCECHDLQVLNIGTPGCKEGAQVDDGLDLVHRSGNF